MAYLAERYKVRFDSLEIPFGPQWYFYKCFYWHVFIISDNYTQFVNNFKSSNSKSVKFGKNTVF